MKKYNVCIDKEFDDKEIFAEEFQINQDGLLIFLDKNKRVNAIFKVWEHFYEEHESEDFETEESCQEENCCHAR